MTRTFSITMLLGVALLVAAPAWSQTQPDAFERAAPAGQTARTNPIATADAFERAALAGQTAGRGTSTSAIVTGDAFERAALAGRTADSSTIVTGDAFERAAANGPQLVAAAPLPDAFERALLNRGASATVPVLADQHSRVQPVVVETPGPVVSSGRQINWPEIGIGFGLGVLLALGLLLGARVAGMRPLAH